MDAQVRGFGAGHKKLLIGVCEYATGGHLSAFLTS